MVSDSRFRKYDHVERWGHPDVEHLDAGKVHVFPKIDGTNASVWVEPNEYGIELCAGSRTRTLSSEVDNAGFFAWTRDEEQRLFQFIMEGLGEGGHVCHVYGEWLVPHTLKTYREDSWRRFWIFDVYHPELGYLHHDDWAPVARDLGLDVVEPLCTIENPTEDQLHHQVEMNTFLVADNAGVGEGIVLKNFHWKNAHGRQPWAKIVRNEFKERSRLAFGVPELKGAFEIEAAIAAESVTPTLVAKCRAKILVDILAERGGGDADELMALRELNVARSFEEEHRGQIIPRLLQTVYTDVLREELYPLIKKHKDPTVNFKRLRAHCVRLTKEYAADLF